MKIRTEGLDPPSRPAPRNHMIDDLATREQRSSCRPPSHPPSIVEEHADIVGVISRIVNSSPKGKPSELQRRPNRKKRSLEDVFLEVNAELPDATQGPEDESGNHDEKVTAAGSDTGVRIGTTEYRRTLRGLRQDPSDCSWLVEQYWPFWR